MSEYQREIKSAAVKFAAYIEEHKLNHEVKAFVESHAGRGPARGKWFAKSLNASIDSFCEQISDCIKTITEASWLYDKFGVGTYANIPGLCKIATRAEIEDKGWSLTPGAYVGVAPTEDDGVDFAARMAEIHQELLTLQAESNTLMDTISKNMKEMGL